MKWQILLQDIIDKTDAGKYRLWQERQNL